MNTADEFEFKRHPIFTDYWISRTGDVFSTKLKNRPPRQLKPFYNEQGYRRVGLSLNCKVVFRFVHVAVLEAFVSLRPHGKIAAHLNGISTDCRLENLAWVTPRQNYDHMIDHGTRLMGELSSGVKLTLEEVLHIRSCSGMTTLLANRYGVSRICIQKIRRGETWNVEAILNMMKVRERRGELNAPNAWESPSLNRNR